MRSIGVLFAGLWLAWNTGCSRSSTLGPKDTLNLPPNDIERVKVGQPAPDFTLEDSAGQRVTLSSFRGKKFLILVFYRGYW